MQIFVFCADVTRTSINYSMLSITCRCFQRQASENLQEFQTIGINTHVEEFAIRGCVLGFPKTALQLMRGNWEGCGRAESRKEDRKLVPASIGL